MDFEKKNYNVFLGWLCRFEEQLDNYNIIMVKAIADRLAEVSFQLRAKLEEFMFLSAKEEVVCSNK